MTQMSTALFFFPPPPTSAWIKVEQLKPYHPHKEEMIKINKGKRFQQAVDAVEEYLKKAKGKEQVSSSTQASELAAPHSSPCFSCKYTRPPSPYRTHSVQT